MSLTISADRPANPSGPLSPGELTFCHQVRDLVRAALDGRTTFVGVVANVLADLRELRKSGFDVDAATAAGFAAATARPELLGDGTAPQSHLSSEERSFLADLDGFLDFALRNGLTFPSVLNVVAHDVGEIAAHEMSLENARKNYVMPKATGWAKRNADSMREPEAALEDDRGEQD